MIITTKGCYRGDSHQDKHQVVGEGGEGDQHQWNSFDQVSANLKKTKSCG